MDPAEDPCGVMLIIDYLAIKSEQFDYLVRLVETLDPFKNLKMLPCFAYSYALALFLKGDEERAGREVGFCGGGGGFCGEPVFEAHSYS